MPTFNAKTDTPLSGTGLAAADRFLIGRPAADAWDTLAAAEALVALARVADGGSAAVSAAVLPSQTGQAGKYLITDGTEVGWGAVNLSGYAVLAGGNTFSGAQVIQTTGGATAVRVEAAATTGNFLVGVGAGTTLASLSAAGVFDLSRELSPGLGLTTVRLSGPSGFALFNPPASASDVVRVQAASGHTGKLFAGATAGVDRFTVDVNGKASLGGGTVGRTVDLYHDDTNSYLVSQYGNLNLGSDFVTTDGTSLGLFNSLATLKLANAAVLGWGTGNLSVAPDTTLSRNTSPAGGVLATATATTADLLTLQAPASHSGKQIVLKNSVGTTLADISYVDGYGTYFQGRSLNTYVHTPHSYYVSFGTVDGYYTAGFKTLNDSNAPGGLHLSGGAYIAWGSSAYYSTLDTGLARSAAGVVKVTNGSSGYGSLTASSYDLGGVAQIGLSGVDVHFNDTSGKLYLYGSTISLRKRVVLNELGDMLASDVPLTISLAASQTANAFQVKDSVGTTLSYFNSSGDLLFGSDGARVIGLPSSARPLVSAYGLEIGTGSAPVAAELLVASSASQTRITTSHLWVGSGVDIGWSSGTPTATAPDVGLARSAAGVVKVTDGSSGLGSTLAANHTVDTFGFFGHRPNLSNFSNATGVYINNAQHVKVYGVGSVLATFDANDGSVAVPYLIRVGGSQGTTTVPVTINLVASQTADAFQIQNSVGTSRFRIADNGSDISLVTPGTYVLSAVGVTYLSNTGQEVYFTNAGQTVYHAAVTGSGVAIVSGSQFLFSSTSTNATATLDTGLARASAGVVKVTDGSSGYGGLQCGYTSTPYLRVTSSDGVRTFGGGTSAYNNFGTTADDASPHTRFWRADGTSYWVQVGGTSAAISLTVNTGGASYVGQVINLAASQTADAFQVKDSVGATIYSVSKNAVITTMGTGGYPATLMSLGYLTYEAFKVSLVSGTGLVMETASAFGAMAARTGIFRFQDNSGTTYFSVNSTGGTTDYADATNVTFGTTTGTKIGTGTTQKLGFWNATPVVQPTAVADLTTTATSGTLPTPNGSVTIADASAPTVAELLEYCVELEAKLEAVMSRLRDTGLMAT